MLLMTDDEIVKGKDPKYLTTTEERQARLAKCNVCPQKTTVSGFGVCGECNCILGLKTFFKLSPCPLNNWAIPVNELPKEK